MKKAILAIAVSAALSGCGTTETLLAGAGVAGGVLSSLTSSPDYTKYADTCKEIIQAARDAADAEGRVLEAAAKTKPSETLLYMAMRPKSNAFQQCALAVPKGFLDRLAESGNLLNFVAAIYGENRADARAQRQLQVSKELGLANLQHQQEMQELENAFVGQLVRNPVDAFNAGAAAARPSVVVGE